MLLVMTLALLAADEPASYPQAKLLMEPAELRAALDANSALLTFDCRPLNDFSKQSIKHARHLAPERWAKLFNENRDVEKWTELLAGEGIRSLSEPIVIFDDSLTKDSARIWWILRYWGFTNVRILNGGWRGAVAAKVPMREQSAGSEATKPVDAAASLRLRPMRERHAEKSLLLGNLASEQKFLVIDARTEGEHCGKTTTAKRNGAIPGAKHLEWTDLLDRESHRFKSPNELRRLFTEAGIDLNRPLVAYCQSGGRASVMAFALELMGAKDVKNYYASWAEWGNAEDTPVEPGRPKADR